MTITQINQAIKKARCPDCGGSKHRYRYRDDGETKTTGWESCSNPGHDVPDEQRAMQVVHWLSDFDYFHGEHLTTADVNNIRFAFDGLVALCAWTGLEPVEDICFYTPGISTVIYFVTRVFNAGTENQIDSISKAFGCLLAIAESHGVTLGEGEG